MPTLTNPHISQNFYGNVKLNSATLEELQAIAILTAADPVVARIDYFANLEISERRKESVKENLNHLKPTETNVWSETATSDSLYTLELYAMDAREELEKLAVERVSAAVTTSEKLEKAKLLKLIYENQLALIKRQRLNFTAMQKQYKNTSLAATAFKYSTTFSSILVGVAAYVPVVNLFAHPLKLGLEIVTYSLLITAYNLDPQTAEGSTHATTASRQEIIQRREAAKEHLTAIRQGKAKEISTGLLGTAAMFGALFFPPAAPLLAPLAALGLFVSNFYSQKAVQAEIELLKKVGIKRDNLGNPVYETTVNSKGEIVKKPILLLKDYETRLASLEKRLEAKKWGGYAAGTAFLGAVSTSAIAASILLGAASAAFPPLLGVILAVTLCVSIFCILKSIKRTYDEKKLAAKASLQTQDGMKAEKRESNALMPSVKGDTVRVRAEAEIQENLRKEEDLSRHLLAVTDTLQHQTTEFTHVVADNPTPQNTVHDAMNEHELTKRIEHPKTHLKDLVAPLDSNEQLVIKKDIDTNKDDEPTKKPHE